MIDWRAIDTVLLDMDGTLLDLHFDNYFWLRHLPSRYAQHHEIRPEEAADMLHRLIDAKRGSLEWYCLDYWSERLSLDIRALKEEVQHLIAERPHAVSFLTALKAAGKKRVLITNAHRQSLELKISLTGIGSELDEMISSHDYGYPKEDRRFWDRLRETISFDTDKTLFIDDSLSVLRAAEAYGIRQLIAIHQPDSRADRIDTGHFPAIHHFDEIMPAPPAAGSRPWTG